jgi:hypothetical protein
MLRGRVTCLVLAAAIVACGRSSDPQAVADRFMDLYYAHANVAGAVQLCEGAAKTKLERELQAIRGVPRDAGSDEPRVAFTLTASRTPSAGVAAFDYRVVAHTADVGPIATTLTLTSQDGRWVVTSIDEKQSAPAA